MAGEQKLFFTGTTYDVHVRTENDLEDAEWLDLLENIKRDFCRIGREKTRVTSTLKKWTILPNQFLSMAGRCEEEYSKLVASVDKLKKSPYQHVKTLSSNKNFEKCAKRRASAINDIVRSSLELSIFMPVMFESFIGLLIGCFIKPDVKTNERLYNSFIRGALDVKIFDLHLRCSGFRKGIEQSNAYMRRYWEVVNRRNDLLHGNFDPTKDGIGVVYFDNKTPLFKSGSDGLEAFQESFS